MKIVKEAQGGEQVAVTEEELVQINRLSRRELTAEEVYTFSVRLCDNQIDRDGERFPRQTLAELAQLFVGKSGIFDHDWSARGQNARIYRTELVEEDGVLADTGEPYCWLKGYAYMVRTGENESLIREIEGGIKKEVSVGCAVERSVCSICGQDWNGGACGHQKGELYEGRLCFVSLERATDAYEFSFVAVPAQPRAGVVKGRVQPGSLEKLVKGNAACTRELEQLKRQAQAGQEYLDGLRGEVVKLARLADRELDKTLLQTMVKDLDGEQLRALKARFALGAGENYPLKTQFSYGEKQEKNAVDGAFLI
ncbi:MAG: hypothetical protein IKK44_04460 [Clostridium sp.]|nr:hypothetical protein [Clostridium sp.]